MEMTPLFNDDEFDDIPIDPIEGLREIPAAQFPSSARSRLTSELIHQVDWTPDGRRNYKNFDIPFDKTLAPKVSRPDPLYPTTYETMRAQYFDHDIGRDNTSDYQMITDLLKGQPHRIPTALAPEGEIACETLGPLMLPESTDPLVSAPHAPALLPRPKPWSPDSTDEEVVRSVYRDMLDIAALYAARIKTATGHQPDSKGIDQTFKLSVIMKNIHKYHPDRKTELPVKIKRPRRPRRPYITVPIKLTLLSQETDEKNKLVHTPKKYQLNLAKSDLELPVKEKSKNESNVNKIKAGTSS